MEPCTENVLFRVFNLFCCLVFIQSTQFARDSTNVRDSCFCRLCKCCHDNWNSVFFMFPKLSLLSRKIPSTHQQFHSVYGYQTGQDGELPWLPPSHKVTQSFGHVVLQVHVANQSHYDLPNLASWWIIL